MDYGGGGGPPAAEADPPPLRNIHLCIHIIEILWFPENGKRAHAWNGNRRLRGAKTHWQNITFCSNSHYSRWNNMYSGHSVSFRAEGNVNNTYTYTLLIICDFPETENARSREMETCILESGKLRPWERHFKDPSILEVGKCWFLPFRVPPSGWKIQ